MIKSFKKRVVAHLLRQGWNIQYNTPSFIDLFSIRPHSHIKKAYRVKAHGHLLRKEREALCEYGKQAGLHVIFVHEVSGRELEFIRLYPLNLKMEAI